MARKFGWVRKLPSGRYQASYISPDGVRVNAPTTFTKEEHAEKWLAAQRTDIERETWKGPTVGTITIRGYAVPWLAQRTTLKPRTADLYQRLLTLHILPTLGEVQLKALTPAKVREWHAALADSTGPTAQAQAYRLLRTICNQALADGQIAANPCQIRGAANPKTPERPAPTLAQVHALADLVPARYRVMVLVAAYGGLRFGELTALTTADLLLDDPDRPAVLVRKTMTRLDGRWLVGTPKTDAGLRTVTLPRFLHPLLQDHLDRHVKKRDRALVFATASGQPLARSNWTATFHRATKQIGLDDIHFHDLRHAAATAAVQTGATLKDTMARLGHTSPRAALIYQHSAQERDHAIADALETAAAKAQKAKTSPKPTAAEG